MYAESTALSDSPLHQSRSVPSSSVLHLPIPLDLFTFVTNELDASHVSLLWHRWSSVGESLDVQTRSCRSTNSIIVRSHSSYTVTIDTFGHAPAGSSQSVRDTPSVTCHMPLSDPSFTDSDGGRRDCQVEENPQRRTISQIFSITHITVVVVVGLCHPSLLTRRRDSVGQADLPFICLPCPLQQTHQQ